MFEKLITELKKIEKTGIKVSIAPDEEGYIDRECPSELCLYQFKVFEQDWRDIFKDESVFCPLCRHEAHAKSWFTSEHIEHARAQALKAVEATIHNGLVSGAESFNRSQNSRSFITMKMSVQGGKRTAVLLPAKSKDTFEQKISCEKCKARYAVIGSAFFCPSCGHNSVEKTFQNSTLSVIAKIEGLAGIRSYLNSQGAADQAHETCRTIIESAIAESVTALQRYCDQLYAQFPNAKKLSQNAFQRLESMDEAWRPILGSSVKDWLTTQEFEELAILYQKRHLLQHTQGIVDEKYILKSKDSTYSVGQRIVCTEVDAIKLAKLTSRIGAEIKNHINNGLGV